MKLGACICFFNDKNSLKRCLDTLSTLELVICVDGKFPAFSYDSELSDDGSRELVCSYDNTRLLDFPAEEPVKRTRYLDACKEYSITHALMIDSDEYVLEADWDLFEKNCAITCNDASNIYGVWMRYNGKDITSYGRLWYKPWEMEYYKAHMLFRNRKTGNIERSGNDYPIITGITLAWDDTLRDQQYIKTSIEYQKWLIEHEKPIRQAFKENKLS